nr:Abi family protein [uncultured Tyzzerella sp.]
MAKENIYEQQINMLLDKGILIEDKKEVINTLSSLNYYILIGYIPNFTDKNINYKNKISFNSIYKTYLFDRRL